MGVEEFRITLESPFSQKEADARICLIPGTLPVATTRQRMSAFQVIGPDFIFEVSTAPRQDGTIIAIEVAVCHPRSMLSSLIAIVLELHGDLDGRHISLNEDLPPSVNGDFPPASLAEFPNAVAASFNLKRDLWVNDFGAEEAVITGGEALKKFVIKE